MKPSKQIRPISYLKAHAAEIVRNLPKQQEPLIITQNGEAKGSYKTLKATSKPSKPLRF